MAKYSIEDTTLIGIADAIRSQEGSTDTIPVTEMKDRILAIQTGIDTSDATATEPEVANGKTFYANGEKKTGTMPIHNVGDTAVEWRLSSVPPGGGDATMVVDVEEGYYESGAYEVGTLPMYQPQSSITPGTEDVSLPGGAWYMNGVTIKGDANLKPENIRSGITLFGKTGSMTDYSFETWTFTLDDGSTVTKNVAVASLEG